ncbi:MAG: hypothetical protein MK214_00960 [Thalassotalea sp.]|nr:hypothetical protein [Thalassotalea sp.]
MKALVQALFLLFVTANAQATNMKNILSRLAILSLPIVFSTAQASQDYDDLELRGIVKSEYSDIDQFGLTGIEVRASKRWRNVFGELRYRDVSDKHEGIKLEEDRWSASLGYVAYYSKSLHFDIRANHGNIEAELSNEYGSADFDTNYYSGSGFVHYNVLDNVNLYAGLEYQNLKDAPDQKAYHLSSIYTFNALSVGAEHVKYSDSDYTEILFLIHGTKSTSKWSSRYRKSTVNQFKYFQPHSKRCI